MTQFFNMKKEYWREHYADALPPGYRRVEYIESTGEQWIDTVVNGGSDVAISGDFYRTNGEGIMFGCIHVKDPHSTTTRCMMQIYATSSSQHGLMSFYADVDVNVIGRFSPTSASKFHVDADYRSGVYTVDSTTVTRAVVAYTMPVSMYLFARHVLYTTGVEDAINLCQSGFRAYSVQIKKAGSSVRNLVPCVRISDNKPGMYDLCGSISAKTGTSFYVNEGTGADFKWKELDNSMPTDGLVFYAPLRDDIVAATGQTIDDHGQQLASSTINGIKCITKEAADSLGVAVDFSSSVNKCISAWTYVQQYASSSWGGFFLGWTTGTNSWYCAFSTTYQPQIHFGSQVKEYGTSIKTKWAHVLMQKDSTMTYLYIDGQLAGTKQNIAFDVSGGFGMGRYIGGITAARIYNRVLSDSEIVQLAHEFNPTTA